MITDELRKKYLPTIGIECHVQLKTATKLFAAVGNDARDAAPNTLISHICMGMPGALPVLNKQAVHLAVKAGLALRATVNEFSTFERKHYFYPDLPKGYQISQYEQPIITNGTVTILVDGEEKSIGITRAHMEEDAGKSTHPVGKDYSLVDLNRAGTPLLEIVSEPDIHSAVEAKAYARELYLLMRYADVSDADLYYGNMRFDVNISVSADHKKLGKRSEIKNLNSFRAVEASVLYEIDRQIELLEAGKEVVQETRGWDDAKQKTFSQRSKEEAQDYRYMPDPDIPPIVLTAAEIDEIQSKEMPVMPDQLRKEFAAIGIGVAVIEDIINVPEIAKSVLAVKTKAGAEHARRAAFWRLQESQEETDARTGWVTPISDDNLIELSKLVEAGKLSSTAAKQVLAIIEVDGGDPESIATEHGLIQVSDTGFIDTIVAGVLAENPKAAEDVKNGEMKAIGFLVGQVMKQSQGKANPSMAQDIIKKQLGIN